MINPGKYNQKIKILQQVTGRDDYGSPINTWEVLKNKWASKNPLLGNEFFSSLTTDTKVEVKFNMRYDKDIKNEMRIQHGADVFEILSAIDVNTAHVETLCYCKLVK